MATSSMIVRKQVALATALPQLKAPLLGLALVLLHVGLASLGLAFGRLNVCAMTIGALDGTMLSVIAVARLRGHLQAGITGMLSGVSLDSLANGQTIVTKAAQTIHALVDTVIDSLGYLGDETTHKAIENATIEGIWIAIIVVLATLIVNFMSGASSDPVEPAVNHS